MSDEFPTIGTADLTRLLQEGNCDLASLQYRTECLDRIRKAAETMVSAMRDFEQAHQDYARISGFEPTGSASEKAIQWARKVRHDTLKRLYHKESNR